MQIQVNGNPTEVAEPCTLGVLLERLELNGRRLAVEVNEELVPRALYALHHLAPGDRVEIIHAVGGG